MKDKEESKYQEYKRRIQEEGPDSLRTDVESRKIALPYKINAACRALREHDEAQEREIKVRQETREEEHLKLAREANKIARRAWIKQSIIDIVLTIIGFLLTYFWPKGYP